MGYSTAQFKKMLTKKSNASGRTHLANKYGFDTKFLMHGFRISQQGRELLSNATMTFPRPNAQALLDIRLGHQYGKDDLELALEDLRIEQENLRALEDNNVLPASANIDALNELQIQLFEEVAYGQS